MRFFVSSVLALVLLAGCRIEPRAAATDAPEDAASESETPFVPTASSDVTVYVTEWCPYCKATREYLDDVGIEYRAVDIESSEEAHAEYVEQGGDGGIPLVVIGNTRIAGYSIPAFDEALERAGL